MGQRNYKSDFPIFEKHPELVYLDSAATSQKPKQVLDALYNYNISTHANIHRGAYKLSIEATNQYDNVRNQVANYIGAKSSDEIVFTKGTTESINLLASTYGSMLEKGDEIVVSILEHHSNLVPWQQLAMNKELKLGFLYTDEDGLITEDEIEAKIRPGVKLVALTMMSNAIGVKTPYKKVIQRAHDVGGLVLLDAAQAVAHEPINVQALDVDFLAFSGHKMMASTGTGVLYGKKVLLDQMPCYHFGGDMIEYVEEQKTTFAPLPNKFEAGTPNIEGVISLGAAITYIEDIGLEAIQAHEKMLTAYALEELSQLEYIEIIGTKNLSYKGPVISFNVKDVHSHDTAFVLDNSNIAIRSGHHCAQPLMKYLKVPSTARVSFYIYNTKEDIDRLIEQLSQVRRWLGYGS